MKTAAAPTIVPAASPVEAFELRPRPTLGFGGELIGKEEEELVLDVLRRRELFRYYGRNPAAPPPMAAQFEKEYREMVGARYCLAVTSGTAAVEVALGALGVGPGDEVILPAWGWVSCFTAIVRVGARPVLAEVDDTLTLAPGEITRLKTAATKAVLVMHYQGVVSDMEPLVAEARAAGIKVVEDCAQVVGATYRGRYAGTFGDIGTYSFQFNKYITSGEGGAVVTDDPTVYERAVRMHDLGLMRAYHADVVEPQVAAFSGGQYRFPELSAAVLLAQLRKLPKLKAHTRMLQDVVMGHVRGLGGITPRRIPDPAGDTGVEIYLHMPTVAVAEQFRKRLDALNVNSQKLTGSYCHYAREYCRTGDAHAESASPFRGLGEWPAKGYRKEDFPRTEGIVHKVVALPLGATYTAEDADYIGRAVRHVHGELLAGK